MNIHQEAAAIYASEGGPGLRRWIYAGATGAERVARMRASSIWLNGVGRYA